MNIFIKEKARKEIFELDEYVPGKPIEEVKRELGIDDIIKMASNENALGPPPKAVEAIKTALDMINIYPDGNCYLLKEKMSQVLEIEPEAILIGNGSDELLRLIAETFLNKDDEVIFADPTFSEYEFTAKIMGAKCIRVPLKNFCHDLDAIYAAVSSKTKIIYLCNPNNPTGTFLGEDELNLFMQKVPEDILIILDEAYIEYADDERLKSGIKYLKENKNVIVLRTFSKFYGLAALRIGYGLTNPEIARAVRKVFEPFNVNSLAQVAAAAALSDEAYIKNTLLQNKQGKEYLYKGFDQMGLDYVPTQSNFIFVDTGQDARTVFERLLKMGVIIRTGDVFGYPTHIRVTVGTTEQNQRFIASLKTVLRG